MISITLIEGIILLAITGVSVVAWWGVKRIVKTNDDEAEVLTSIHTDLGELCERLRGIEVWMEMHSALDDERHQENKKVLEQLKKDLDRLELVLNRRLSNG